MKSVIVNIPEDKETMFLNFLKKHHLNNQVIEPEEDEDLMVKWIDEGMKSEEVPLEKVYQYLRKHGVNC